MARPTTSAAARGADVDTAAVGAKTRALEGLRYGQVDVHVHDARVVRIMRTEKTRCYDECTKTPDVR